MTDGHGYTGWSAWQEDREREEKSGVQGNKARGGGSYDVGT